MKMCGICQKVTINIVESRSGVFIINFKHISHISHFFGDHVADFEQVNVCRGPFSCVNIVT